MFLLVKESALILLQTVPKEIKIKQLKRDIVKKVSFCFDDLVFLMCILVFVN